MMGTGTHAYCDNQLVLGTYNEDRYGNDLFVIGNGTSDDDRATAFKVDVDGYAYPRNVRMDDWVILKRTVYEWHYEKYYSGKIEAWGGPISTDTLTMTKQNNLYRSNNIEINIPTGIFPEAPTYTQVFAGYYSAVYVAASGNATASNKIKCQIWKDSPNTASVDLKFHCVYYPSNY